jgi:endonuclease G
VSIPNHNLPFRPVRGGISVWNPQVEEPGTIGCLLTLNGTDRWILSCYHVFGRLEGAAFPDSEPIYQPSDNIPPIAQNSVSHSNWALDCSAARLNPGIASVPDILGLPPIAGTEEPHLGMRVIKSGATTGVTEGIVTAINGDTVEIGLPPQFDPQYELSDRGDSGSVWINQQSGKIVALHKGGASNGPHRGYATRILPILTFLQMEIVT